MTKTKTKKTEKVTFQLKGVELLESFLKHPQKQLPEKITYHFNINVEHRINIDSKFVFVVITINVSDESNKDTMLGQVITSCNFKLNNMEDYIGEKKKVDFPDEILNTLNMIAISTTRGVMFSQFRGTFLHEAYLPLIDPNLLNPSKK